jgi:acyl-CoA synthetase (AMP-forming)/AMP-acid ligase II
VRFIYFPLTFSNLVYSPNCLAWPLTFFGLIAAGLRPTLANSFYTPPELAHQIKDSRAKKVFVHPTLFPVLMETFRLLGVSEREARTRVVIMSYVDHDRADEKAVKIGGEWTRLSEFFGKGRLPSEELFVGDQAHETALLCYSSGMGLYLSPSCVLSILNRDNGTEQGRRSVWSRLFLETVSYMALVLSLHRLRTKMLYR